MRPKDRSAMGRNDDAGARFFEVPTRLPANFTADRDR